MDITEVFPDKHNNCTLSSTESSLILTKNDSVYNFDIESSIFTNNIYKLQTKYLVVDENNYMQIELEFDDNHVLDNSFIFYGSITDGTIYIENEKSVLFSSADFKKIHNVFSNIEKYNAHEFIFNYSPSLISMFDIYQDTDLKYNENIPKIDNQHSFFIDLNIPHKIFLSSILQNHQFSLSKTNCQILIQYSEENSIEFIENKIVCNVKNNFIESNIFILENINLINELIVSNNLESLVIDYESLPKSDGGCCGGGCDKGESCCQNKNDTEIETSESKCCKGKTDEDCCGGYKTDSCNSGCKDGNCASCN